MNHLTTMHSLSRALWFCAKLLKFAQAAYHRQNCCTSVWQPTVPFRQVAQAAYNFTLFSTLNVRPQQPVHFADSGRIPHSRPAFALNPLTTPHYPLPAHSDRSGYAKAGVVTPFKGLSDFCATRHIAGLALSIVKVADSG